MTIKHESSSPHDPNGKPENPGDEINQARRRPEAPSFFDKAARPIRIAVLAAAATFGVGMIGNAALATPAGAVSISPSQKSLNDFNSAHGTERMLIWDRGEKALLMNIDSANNIRVLQDAIAALSKEKWMEGKELRILLNTEGSDIDMFFSQDVTRELAKSGVTIIRMKTPSGSAIGIEPSPGSMPNWALIAAILAVLGTGAAGVYAGRRFIAHGAKKTPGGLDPEREEALRKNLEAELLEGIRTASEFGAKSTKLDFIRDQLTKDYYADLTSEETEQLEVLCSFGISELPSVAALEIKLEEVETALDTIHEISARIVQLKLDAIASALQVGGLTISGDEENAGDYLVFLATVEQTLKNCIDMFSPEQRALLQKKTIVLSLNGRAPVDDEVVIDPRDTEVWILKKLSGQLMVV